MIFILSKYILKYYFILIIHPRRQLIKEQLQMQGEVSGTALNCVFRRAYVRIIEIICRDNINNIQITSKSAITLIAVGLTYRSNCIPINIKDPKSRNPNCLER